MQHREISELINRHRPRYSLVQDFYRDPDIYQLELDEIFLKTWQYAGHVSEIPEPGNFFLFEYANESVIVIRDKENEVHALMNVCRHRGSRVCLEKKGKANRLICRYHAWTYGLDGELKNTRYMPEDFDKSQFGLHKAHVRILYGLIYVNLAGDPASFEPIERELNISLKPYRLENAKVAHRHSYPIKANWKLAVENYCECYHCAPAHPEYAKAHSLAMPDAKYTEEMDAVMARSEACGLSDHMVLRIFGDAESPGADYGYERYPLLRGHVTGSKDGQPVAPLLGDLTDYDGGTTDFQVGPINFALAYCDHVVMYRFTPVSQNETECDISWLVRDELTWLWDVTTIADQHIIERNQQGVDSHFYQPGPFSEMENRCVRLLDWYLNTLKNALS
jgi:Rieske 2Fe-2S family protein